MRFCPVERLAATRPQGLEGRVGPDELRRRVAQALQMVGLEDVGSEYPGRLSGGMAQRAQLARALALEPKVLLMDEPFGSLDAITKAALQDALLRIQDHTDTTVVFITHDLDEAIYLSDRVVVLTGAPGVIKLVLDTEYHVHEINWRLENCHNVSDFNTGSERCCGPRNDEPVHPLHRPAPALRRDLLLVTVGVDRTTALRVPSCSP